jgi:acyl-CoA synthetase (AMP-forming)/AMP-acid ligase II
MDNYLKQILNWKRFGIAIVSSGTTGEPKLIWRTPDNLRACNEVAIHAQQLTSKSKVLTVTKTDHAGGLLLQTLPAYTLGCKVIDVEKFNPWTFIKKVKGYTHTFLTPEQMKAVMMTKGFRDCDLTGIRILGGSNPVSWEIIKAFVSKGALVQPNWGMSEIGPMVINIEIDQIEHIEYLKQIAPEGSTILGNAYWCDWKIDDGELYVKSDMCIEPGWFATGDMVTLDDENRMYYQERKMYK